MHPAMMGRKRPKACKQCGAEFTPARPLQAVCGLQCAVASSREKALVEAARIEAKRIKERKVELKPRSKWLQEAQAAVNAYVRARDAHLPCISCQRYHTGQYHAGHYRSVGAMPSLRFCAAWNIHKQCSACNNHLSGAMIDYRINLIAKFRCRLPAPDQEDIHQAGKAPGEAARCRLSARIATNEHSRYLPPGKTVDCCGLGTAKPVTTGSPRCTGRGCGQGMSGIRKAIKWTHRGLEWPKRISSSS
jgi:Bacteriophage Lambda NinG protein